LQNTYTKNDNVLIAIAPKDGKVFTNSTLSIIEELTRASWQTPYSIRVDSISNFQYTRAEEDDLIVEDLVKNARGLSNSQIANIKRVSLKEPLLRDRLINRSGSVTGVNITVNMPEKSIMEVPEVTAYVRGLVGELREKNPDVDFYLSGIVVMNNAFSEASQNDAKTLNPIMFVVLIVIMGFLLRSVSGTFATVLVILMSALTAMGIAGWLGIPLTPLSVIAPNIILTLAIADSIHILVTIFHDMRHGMEKREAIVESLRINMQPVFLTSLTTMIGFLSMNFSDAPPYRDLGNIVAIGVAAAFIFSVLFLPAVISILPLRVKRQREGKRPVFDHFGEFVVKNRQKLFWGMLVLIIVVSAGVGRIELNDRFTEYFSKKYIFRQDTDFVTKNLTGIYQIEYSLGAGEEGGVSEPEYLKKVEEFADWYRVQDGVMHVSTITDIMKRLNRSMHGDDNAYYKLPESRELAAQYLLLYELSLPYGLDLNNQININKSATRFSLTLESLTTKELMALEGKAQKWLKANAPEHMQFKGASPAIMFGHIAERNIKGMFTGTGLAIVLISGVLIIALWSFKMGIISLVPNIVPALMAFGLWGLLFAQVGFAVSVVAAMSLGMVVDDTVHFLSKYVRARREHGLNSMEAVCYSFRTVGTALWVSSITLISGFAVFAFSGFTMNSDMGMLTAITLAIALIADFLFLPPL
ncbi:MAG: MMPL family transporter, partial [Thermodesulfobacteriota bacterium]